MSYHLQIDCARRDDRLNPYERVRAVGGPNVPGTPPPDGSKLVAELRKRGLAIKESRRWSLPVDDAIRGILDGTWSFFIELGVYDLVSVEVAQAQSGRLYLKTQVDSDTPDQLLYLPQCR